MVGRGWWVGWWLGFRFAGSQFDPLRLRGAGQQTGGGRRGLLGDGVVTAMAVRLTRRAFLLDVGDLAAGGQFAVATDHTSTRQRPKAEEPHQTHYRKPPLNRGAKHVPLSGDVARSCRPLLL